MNILVTGANGFVGHHLIAKLEEQGHKVVEVTRASHGDISLIEDWSPLLRENAIDAVVHLAAKVHQINENLSLSDYQKINVEVTKKLALASSQCEVKTFLFLSSVKVNGEENSDTYTEFSSPLPLDPYGQSKLQAEKEVSIIAKTSPMFFVTLRPPLIYGPKVKANMRSLVRMVHKGLPLPFGSIKNKRSFLYVENLVDAIVRVLSLKDKPSGQNFIYLISDNDDCSFPHLISDISEILGVRNPLFSFPTMALKLLFQVIGKEEQFRRIAHSLTLSPSKFMADFNWSPPYSRKEGLLHSFGRHKDFQHL